MARHIQAVFTVTVESWQDLTVVAVEGVESLGRPYDFWITAVAPDGATFDAREAVGEKATLVFKEKGGELPSVAKRVVNGVVTAIEDSFDLAESHRIYKFRLQPPIALLQNIVGQELYVGVPIPDVIKSKMVQGDINLPHRFSLHAALYVDGNDTTTWQDAPGTGHPSEPRLVTQYKESDLAFVMRLCEHAGISLCFESAETGDKALFVDQNEDFPTAADKIPFQGDGTHAGIVSLKRRTRWVPTIVMVADYNYRAPTATLIDGAGHQVFDVLGAKVESTRPWPGLLVDYASNVKNEKEAKYQALIQKELLETECDQLEGQGHIPEMTAGLRFKIGNHGTISDTAWHVAVEVVHHYESPNQSAGSECGKDPQFRCTFQAVPLLTEDAAFTVRPQRRTPKPRIHGFVTGVIVGPAPDSDPELHHIDTVGRYLVHLHFAQGDTRVLPPIRMAQSHAGPNYGIHFPLRPGTEVLVAFVDGDPDRPVIVGSVPNALTRTPVYRPETDQAAAVAVVEPNRILSRSGILIEISDGDPPPTTN